MSADLILGGILGGTLGALIGLVTYVGIVATYPHRLKIFQRVNGTTIVHHTLARPGINKSGNRVWKLGNKKIAKTCPLPIPEALEFNSKGKYSASCFMDDQGQVVAWIKYDKAEYAFSKDPKTKKLTKVPLNETETFSAEERSYYLEEFIQADAIKGTSLMDKLVTIAPVIVLGMVVALGILFAPDALKSYKEVQQGEQNIINQQAIVTAEIAKAMGSVNQILLNKQKIEGIAPPDIGATSNQIDKGD